MKRQLYIYGLIAFVLSGVLYASTELQYFTAKSEQSAILLEWKTGFEDNLNHFEIERSASNTNNFVKIESISAIGSNSYYYFRDDVASSPQSNTIYYYRLKLVANNSSYAYSNTVIVNHVISSVRDTWGSIKAIFR
jgi:hypothetical protein